MHILHYFKFGSASLQGRNSKQSKICISQLDYLDCKTFSVHKYASHALWRSLKLHNPSDFVTHFAYARKLDKKDILWVCWYAKKILKLTVEFKKFKLGLAQTCVGRLTSWKKNYLYASMLFPRFQFSNTFFASIDHQRKSNGPKKSNPLFPQPVILIFFLVHGRADNF